MKTMSMYNSLPVWFSPFAEPSLFEPFNVLGQELSESLKESSEGYSLEYRVPEYRKRDLSIKLENDTIRVEGNTKQNKSKWFGRSHTRYENSFVREIPISDDMDVDRIKARYKKGFLTINIPKKKEYINFREIPVGGHSDLSAIEERKDKSKSSLLNNIKHSLNSLSMKTA